MGKAAKPVSRPRKTGERFDTDEIGQTARETLLSIAVDMFASSGFDAISVRDIARQAGMNHRMVSYYFGTKESLWKEAVTFLFDRMDRELSLPETAKLNDLESADLAKLAREGIRAYIRYCAAHPEHTRLMFQASMKESALLDWAAENFIGPQQRPFYAMLKLLQDKGLAPKISPVVIIYTLVGAAQTFYALAPEIRRVWDIDPMSEKLIEEHTEAMLAYFTRPA